MNKLKYLLLKNLASQILILGIFIGLIGCAPSEDDFKWVIQNESRSLNLNKGEAEEIYSHPIFWDIRSENTKQIEEWINQDVRVLDLENKRGQTPLEWALQNGKIQAAKTLLKKMQVQHIYRKNKYGRTYLSLAAQAGLGESVHEMAERDRQLKGWSLDYEFSDLDQPDDKGQTALFYARDRTVIEVLRAQYYHGIGEVPFRSFLHHLNNAEQNFVFTAIEMGHEDVVHWSLENQCMPGAWENSQSIYKRVPAQALNWFKYIFSIYISDVRYPGSPFLNWRDKEGHSPLSYAIINRRWSIVRSLMDCQWIDFDQTYLQGQSVVHLFLDQLDPYQLEFSDELKDVFRQLITRETKVKRIWKGVSERINHQDHDGNSVFHRAAIFRNPYFYNVLLSIGNRHLKNHKNQTPELLRRGVL